MLRILTYHRIADPSDTPLLDPRIVSATPQVFARQMEHLDRFYRVVSIQEVLEAAQGRGKLPKRSVLLTFDDAYTDFGRIAWPILKDHGFAVTLFVPTAYPGRHGRSFWWDRLHRAVKFTDRRELRLSVGTFPNARGPERDSCLATLRQKMKELPHMEAMSLIEEIDEAPSTGPGIEPAVHGWDVLRRLSREGVTLGAHTRTHPILDKLSEEEIRAEVRGSQSDLQREIGEVLPIFAYPDGGHDDHVVEVLRQEGFELAFTTRDGTNDLKRHDLLRLRRTNITPRTSVAIFRLRLLPFVTQIDAWRHAG